MVNLKQLLENNQFSYITLLNPSVDLNRPMEAVDTAETPDVYFYVAKNTFLITTAMIYKDNQDQLCDLIRKLADLPITALVIKLGRFIDQLDVEVIKTATELNFPLLLIPQHITTGEVYRQVTSYLVGNYSRELLFTINMQKKFYNFALEDSDLINLIQSLSSMIKRTVVLVDPFGNVSTSSKGFDAIHYRKPIRDTIENIQDLGDRKSVKKSKILDSFNQNINIDIYPIKISIYYPYYLIIFAPNDYLSSSINLSIEQAILVIAFSLYKDLRVSFSNLSTKYNFLSEIILFEYMNDISESSLYSLIKKHNILDSDYYQAVIISVVHNKAPIETHSFRVEWFTLEKTLPLSH